jgi:DNA primase
MHDSAKYLIHADITANGVVERNDVVGAIFGQTEGLLGEDLDLRELQDHSKVGRIDVDVDSEGGQSFGEITIASGLDRVETALLAASLETIERVGPCRATIEVSELEDVRQAKRRTVVDRATDLLADLEADAVTSVDIVDEVRQRVRVENVTEYEGYPAGPRVADSDAIVVVEGRADVLQLLQYGVKNAIAVEGTDVPEAVADLTRRRTVTAFLDGDRGGELVMKELAQVGSVDYVAFAPPGTSVEDLSRGQITAALREKVPAESVVEATESSPFAEGEPDTQLSDDEGAAGDGTRGGTPDSVGDGSEIDGSTADESGAGDSAEEQATGEMAEADGGTADHSAHTDAPISTTPGDGATPADTASTVDVTMGESTAAEPSAATATDTASSETTDTVAGHVQAVIAGDSGRVRLLDGTARALEEGPVEDAFDLVEELDAVPETVVLDGPVSQRLLDVAAQRGVGQVVGASEGEFVKQPTNVRVRTIDDF